MIRFDSYLYFSYTLSSLKIHTMVRSQTGYQNTMANHSSSKETVSQDSSTSIVTIRQWNLTFLSIISHIYSSKAHHISKKASFRRSLHRSDSSSKGVPTTSFQRSSSGKGCKFVIRIQPSQYKPKTYSEAIVLLHHLGTQGVKASKIL